MSYILKENERAAVRKGGAIVHVLPLNEEGKAARLAVALCGNGPKESANRSFTRAGWYGTGRPVNCPKCLKILEERGDD